jgi:hypothetical protein
MMTEQDRAYLDLALRLDFRLEVSNRFWCTTSLQLRIVPRVRLLVVVEVKVATIRHMTASNRAGLVAGCIASRCVEVGGGHLVEVVVGWLAWLACSCRRVDEPGIACSTIGVVGSFAPSKTRHVWVVGLHGCSFIIAKPTVGGVASVVLTRHGVAHRLTFVQNAVELAVQDGVETERGVRFGRGSWTEVKPGK